MQKRRTWWKLLFLGMLGLLIFIGTAVWFFEFARASSDHPKDLKNFFVGTEWGMTSDQVKALYPHATFMTWKGGGALRIENFNVLDHGYRLSMSFENDRLARVELVKGRPSMGASLGPILKALEKEVAKEYGSPALQQDLEPGRLVVWESKGDSVTLYHAVLQDPGTEDIIVEFGPRVRRGAF